MANAFRVLLTSVSFALVFFACSGEDGAVGAAGERGEQGEAGVGCSIAKNDDGVSLIVCGSDTLVVDNLKGENNDKDSAVDGEDGADGADGKDGENGKDGEDGKDGVDGKNGTSCRGELLPDSSIQISCGDSVVGVLKNGEKGEPGEPGGKGDPGDDAEPCEVTDDSLGTITLTCANDTIKFFKALCDGKPYDPNNSFCSSDYKVKDLAVCNETKYNSEIYYCSSENVVVPLAACGWKRFNPETHYCNYASNEPVSCNVLPEPLTAALSMDPDGFYAMGDVYKSLKCSDRVAFVIRHAERIDSSGSGVPINDKGKTAAKTLGEAMRSGESFSYYGSSVLRANQTGWFLAIGRGEITPLDTNKFPSTSSYWLDGERIMEEDSTYYKEIYKDNKTYDESSWMGVSAWAYNYLETVLDTNANRWLENVYAAMEKSNRVSIMVSHDYLLTPFIIWASQGRIDLKCHDDNSKRWANYLSGVAVVAHDDGTKTFYPIKGMDFGYMKRPW